MKKNLIRFSHQYVTALRHHLASGARNQATNGTTNGTALGRQAVVFGLETLDLARVHEQALKRLEMSNAKNATLKRAEKFFNEANRLIEETHGAARQSTAHLSRLKETLDHRTTELAATNRQLQRGVVRRKVMQDALEKNGSHYKSTLEESLQLQKRLRQLAHQLMATQEEERKKISHQLQNEIAQTLLGINVRLLSLKQVARSDTEGFKNEIASTQRLVAESAQSVRQVARKLKRA